jgi:acyl-coenzyme A synthetase/AMP-(fatty) acid ligase
LTPDAAKLLAKIILWEEDMAVLREPVHLANMVRRLAKSRDKEVVFEFEGRQTSFAQFDVLTNRVANGLIALGVRPRERIAYLGKNSDIFFELLLGAMKANVVMTPVNWRLAAPEIAFIIADCKAPVLFVGPRFAAFNRNCLSCAWLSRLKAARRIGKATRLGGMHRVLTIRKSKSGDRTLRSSSIRPAQPENRKEPCCRMPIFSI